MDIQRQSTLEDLLKEILRQVVREEINQALAHHLPSVMAPQQTAPEIMDIDDVAQYLKLSKLTIYGMVHQMKIPNYKRGKRLYFYRSDLDEYISRGRRKTAEEIEQEAMDYMVKRYRKH